MFQSNGRSKRWCPALAASALLAGVPSVAGTARAEQPPPPGHSNPTAAQDEATLRARGDIASLPVAVRCCRCSTCAGFRPAISAPALEGLLGEDAAGLSPTNIARLTACWEQEYTAFRQRDLTGREYVYVWVDGVHFNIRL